MMDSDNATPSLEAEMGNGNHYEHHFQEEETIVAKVASITLGDDMDTEGSYISSESYGSSNNVEVAEPMGAEVVESSSSLDNGNTLSVTEVEMKRSDEVKASKPHIGKVKVKTNNILGSKNSSGTLPKKKGNPKEAKEISNGTMSAHSRPKQMVTKSGLHNDSHVKYNPIKTQKSAPPVTNGSKLEPVKTDSASSAENASGTESSLEKEKLRTLRKRSPVKKEGESETTISSSSGDGKSNSTGKLPFYSFSFRCNERAERRKEFNSKIEEKIHAKEVEKNNLQAKSKETQAAEIKMLRRSLTFKATPMPSFYQEPAPAKVELKKIPPTRPKSPKLGRNKSSSAEDPLGESNRINRADRLSLDERTMRHKLIKKPSPAHVKKPLRRSVPRLPSEKTNLSSRPGERPPTLTASQQDSPSNGDVNKRVPAHAPSHIQSIADDVPPIQDESQPCAEQETVATEH